MNQPSHRLAYLDISKGIAIISIVLLHFATGFIPLNINVFIGSYMISMFYVVSGWINASQQKQVPFKTFLRKRWYQLAVPYIAWTLIILLFDVILWIFGYYDTYFIAREVYKSVVFRGIGTLWFLPALFGAEIIWWWVRHKRSYSRCILMTVLVAVIVYLYGYFFSERLTLAQSIKEAPFRVVLSIATAWLGVAAGFCFRRYAFKWIASRHKIVIFLIGLAIVSGGYYCALWFPIPALWSFGAPLLAPIGIILIIMVVETSPLLHYFHYWGRNSMALMVTHFSILMVLCDIVVRLLYGTPMKGGWIALAMFGFTMTSEYFIAEWLSKRFPRILGHPTFPGSSKRCKNNKPNK